MKKSNLKRTLKSKKKSSKKSKSVPKRKVNKKNTKVKKRSAVKNNKTNKQKGGSQVGENYDGKCYQLSKRECKQNIKNCIWLATKECVIKKKRCSICYENIFSLTKEKGKTVSKQVLDLAAPNNCNHVFCIDCAKRLSESSGTRKCPECRTTYDYFNNVFIDKNNVLVRSSEQIKKLDIFRTTAIEQEYDSDESYDYEPDDENVEYEVLFSTTPRPGVRITEDDVRRTFPYISNYEIRDFLTLVPNTARYGDIPGNRAYVQEILINILSLWINFVLPRHNLHNRFKDLIRTSFNLNENQLNSFLSEGYGVNDNVANVVFDGTISHQEQQWYLEASNNQYPRDASIDDFNDHAFNMMNRYIDEYKRVSIFES